MAFVHADAVEDHIPGDTRSQDSLLKSIPVVPVRTERDDSSAERAFSPGEGPDLIRFFRHGSQHAAYAAASSDNQCFHSSFPPGSKIVSSFFFLLSGGNMPEGGIPFFSLNSLLK